MRKLQIGIYSTEPEWLEKSKAMIEKRMQTLKDHIEIHRFENASKLWGGVKRDALHILFVDIEQDGEIGIQLAKKINQEWPFCQIVYVSNNFQHVMDVYETKHIYYILKEKFEEKLSCIVDKAIRQLRANHHKEIVFQCHGGVIVSLCLSEIMYFERNLRVTYIVAKNSKYIIDEKISELEARIMSEDFVRCHSSFLVNLSYVKECMKKKLVLKNGQVIDISRSYWGKVEKEYIQWAKKAAV